MLEYSIAFESVMKALKDALGVDFKPCVNFEMSRRISDWSALYADEPSWKDCAKGVYTAGIPAAISSELARLVTFEMKSEVNNAEINKIYQRAIDEIRIPVEFGCALGGVLLKPYLDSQSRIATQYIRADRFFPLAFDASRNMSQCVLMDQVFVGSEIYTRLEVHLLEPAGLMIYNLAFRGSKSTAGLGTQITLDEVPQWVEFLPEASYPGVTKLPFGYFKMPLANTFEPDSPLGVSIFARAVDLIKEADYRYSNLCWEYEAKQAAIHIASSLLKIDDAGNTIYPQNRERLYLSFDYNVGATDKPLIDPYSPEIRDSSIYSGFQNQLKMIEYVSGLAYGTISDPQVVEKTATEIKSSKQRSYVTIADTQKALQVALEDFVLAIAFLLGTTAPTVTFKWDDSVINDPDALQRQKLLEFSSGLIDAVQYHMDVYGLKEADAIKLVDRIVARATAAPTTEEDVIIE